MFICTDSEEIPMVDVEASEEYYGAVDVDLDAKSFLSFNSNI